MRISAPRVTVPPCPMAAASAASSVTGFCIVRCSSATCASGSLTYTLPVPLAVSAPPVCAAPAASTCPGSRLSAMHRVIRAAMIRFLMLVPPLSGPSAHLLSVSSPAVYRPVYRPAGSRLPVLFSAVRAVLRMAHVPLYYHDFPLRARGFRHLPLSFFLLVLLISIIIFCCFTFLVKYTTMQSQQKST